MTTHERPVRAIPTGNTVIHTGHDGQFRWDGPSDDLRFVQIAIAYGRDLSGLRCDPRDVAPAGITIPTQDGRVAVAKVARGLHPTDKPWLVDVASDRLGFHKTRRGGLAAGLRTVAIRDWHAGVEAKPAHPDDHHPLTNLNTTGQGIRSYFSCSCGWKPKRMPESGRMSHVPFMRHAAGFGIRRDNFADARYADGYPAAGMTWNEWYAANPDRDPFTNLTHDERFGSATT